MNMALIDRELLAKQLEAGVKYLQLELMPGQKDQLLDYLELLVKWNKAYNLTAIRNPSEMVSKHLLDSLTLTPYITGQRIIDVGTGPGLPGIPMAIMYPDRAFTLLDSNSKKTRFLTQCKLDLGLQNIEIIHSRVDEFHPDKPFDLVLSRAFSAIENMVNWCAHLPGDNGVFLAMKGIFPSQELEALPDGYEVKKTEKLMLPDCEAERHLLIIGTLSD